MIGLPIPRILEAAIAAAVMAIVAALIAWRIHTDLVFLPAIAFGVVFLATLWRNRTSTIHHRSNRTRRGVR